MRQIGLICHKLRLKLRTYLDKIRTFRLAKKFTHILHQNDYCNVKDSNTWKLLVSIEALINFNFMIPCIAILYYNNPKRCSCAQSILFYFTAALTASVVQWSEFLATDAEVSGPIPGATRFSEQQWVWNGVHSAS